MKLKKGELKVLVIVFLSMLALIALAVYVFVRDANKCDEEMGYQCDASQVFQYNKKVD